MALCTHNSNYHATLKALAPQRAIVDHAAKLGYTVAMGQNSDRDRVLIMGIRQALLMILDCLERWLDISPTTAEIRKLNRAG